MISGRHTKTTSGSKASSCARSGRGSAPARKSMKVGTTPSAGSSSESTSKNARWPTKARRTGTLLKYARVRVCFLRTDPGPVELAAALEQAGDVEVVVTERPPEGRWDVAIACDWRACAAVFDVDAARPAALLVALEHRALDPARPERLPALLALDLPLDYLVTSAWVERALADARPGARAWRVALPRPAVAVSPVVPADGGPLRVAGAAPEVLEAMEESA